MAVKYCRKPGRSEKITIFGVNRGVYMDFYLSLQGEIVSYSAAAR